MPITFALTGKGGSGAGKSESGSGNPGNPGGCHYGYAGI